MKELKLEVINRILTINLGIDNVRLNYT